MNRTKKFLIITLIYLIITIITFLILPQSDSIYENSGFDYRIMIFILLWCGFLATLPYVVIKQKISYSELKKLKVKNKKKKVLLSLLFFISSIIVLLFIVILSNVKFEDNFNIILLIILMIILLLLITGGVYFRLRISEEGTEFLPKVIDKDIEE